MKRFFGMLCLIVLISGCVSNKQLVETPPEMRDSLFVYGTLADYKIGDVAEFKINTEFVNYEPNKTYLEIAADDSNTPDIVETFMIYSIDELEVGKKYIINDDYRGVYNGTILSDKKVYIMISGSLMLESDFKNASYKIVTQVSELKKGEKYVFNFLKMPQPPGLEDDGWRLISVTDDLSKYKQVGKNTYSCSVFFNFIKELEKGQESDSSDIITSSKLIYPLIKEDNSFTVELKLTNTKDAEISYEISSAISNVNLAPYVPEQSGRRIKNEKGSDRCEATGLEQSGTIGGNSEMFLEIQVTCDYDENLLDKYETFNDYYIESTLNFTDPLGNEHTVTTDDHNSFYFSIRPDPRCEAPDDEKYILHEDLPIGEGNWIEKTYYYFIEGYTIDPEKVSFTELGDGEIVLHVDNPNVGSTSPLIIFEEEMPETDRRVQIYGILDQGNLYSYRWCYV